MIGALILIFVLVVAIPVGVMMSSVIAAVLLGQDLTVEAEARHEGSELIDLTK